MARKPKIPPPSSSHPDPVRDYADAVLAGEIVAGPHVRNACRRHIADLKSGKTRGLRFDHAAALRAIDFFGKALKLAQKFDGLPFILHPSQQFIIGSLFGWKRGEFRRFRRAYIEQGKGNGKSPMAAGIGMYMLLADGEKGAEVYAGASQKSQAMVLFRDAVAMWRQSPALADRLVPSGGNPIWSLADLKTGSFFRPISTDEAHSGPRPSCALLDEIHEHRDGNMIEMMERGFKSRDQPLLIMITNSGSDRNSVCWQEHLHAVKCAAGTTDIDADALFIGDVIDDTTFSFVCCLDTADDPLEDPSCWVKANPLLGITIPTDELERAVRQARAIPGKLNNILRLHFCEWTSSDLAWISRATLEGVLHDFDPEMHNGETVFIGLDLSATQDLTAMAFVVPTGSDRHGPTFDAWVEAWTPADTLAERALRDNAPYDLWVRDGWLNATPGKVINFAFAAARVAEIVGAYDVQSLAYDSYGFGRLFEPELDSLGLTMPLVEHPQGGKKKGTTGLWMPGSKISLENLILERRIRLRSSPLMISACMAAATENDPFGNFWFSKRKATMRIDALIALTMAVGSAVAEAKVPEYQMFFG